MKRTCILSLGLAGALLVNPARAQGPTGVIRGTVHTDAGAPLAQANVVLDGTRTGAVTGTDGRFVIARVAPGSYTLRAARIGYAPTTKPVQVERMYALWLKTVAGWPPPQPL